jgi:hypothetical protein
MQSKSNEARRRGIRAAAQVAAIGGLFAATAGLVRAEGMQPSTESAQSASDGIDSASSIADAMRVQPSSKGCGCGPCWGPPAPPELPAEHAARLAEAA